MIVKIFTVLLKFFTLINSAEVVVGGLSVYWPGDSCRTGTVMSCDRPRKPVRYREGSIHVAIRTWWRIGCGTKVVVCSDFSSLCEVAPVLDGGPWGIIRGRLRKAVAEGRHRVWVKQRPPRGWRFRAVADLSRELWRRLGSPPIFSRISIYYIPTGRRYP